MDRGASWSTVHGVPRVRHNLVTKPASVILLLIGKVYLIDLLFEIIICYRYFCCHLGKYFSIIFKNVYCLKYVKHNKIASK